MADDFTPGETKILISILKNLEGDLKSDFAAVAAECGLKDASIAKMRWGQIKRKKIQPNGSATSAGVKKTPTPDKKTTAAGGKGKGGRKGAKVVEQSDEDEEDGGGEEDGVRRIGGARGRAGKGKVVEEEHDADMKKVKEEEFEAEDSGEED